MKKKAKKASKSGSKSSSKSGYRSGKRAIASKLLKHGKTGKVRKSAGKGVGKSAGKIKVKAIKVKNRVKLGKKTMKNANSKSLAKRKSISKNRKMHSRKGRAGHRAVQKVRKNIKQAKQASAKANVKPKEEPRKEYVYPGREIKKIPHNLPKTMPRIHNDRTRMPPHKRFFIDMRDY